MIQLNAANLTERELELLQIIANNLGTHRVVDFLLNEKLAFWKLEDVDSLFITAIEDFPLAKKFTIVAMAGTGILTKGKKVIEFFKQQAREQDCTVFETGVKNPRLVKIYVKYFKLKPTGVLLRGEL